MKNYLTDKGLWQKILIFFLMIQPFLDCYILYDNQVTAFFKFSPTTIVRTLIIGILFVVIFLYHSEKKEKRVLITYTLLVAIYFVFHHWNAGNYNSLNPDNFVYSIKEELFYFLRMIFPIFITFIVYKMDWTFKRFEKVILFVVTIISVVIVGSNLLGISLTSYGGNNIIKGNLLTWFNSNNTLEAEWLASKGWFYMANQISGLLSLLLPLTIYIVIKDFSYKKLGILMLQLASMILLGTRVAAIGCILILIGMLIMYAYQGFVKKEFDFDIKMALKVIGCLVIMTILLIKSPVINRTYDDQYFEKEKALKKEYEKKNPNKVNGVYKQLSMSAVNPEFYIKLYPYKENKQFWKDVIELPYYKRSGNRNIELLVTDDIYTKNNNPFDKWLGMSFSRMRSGEIYIEYDFVAHYYVLGIVGTILFLGPFVIFLIWKGLDTLIHYKNKFTFLRVTLLASLAVTLGLSVLSGHVMDELIVTIFLGFVCGLLLKKDVEWSDEINEKN